MYAAGSAADLGAAMATARAAAAAPAMPLFGQPGPLPPLEAVEQRVCYRARPEGETEEVRRPARPPRARAAPGRRAARGNRRQPTPGAAPKP
jgi:hypothetical protein